MEEAGKLRKLGEKPCEPGREQQLATHSIRVLLVHGEYSSYCIIEPLAPGHPQNQLGEKSSEPGREQTTKEATYSIWTLWA